MSTTTRYRPAVFIVALTAIALVLRFAGAANSLWLDELLSLRAAGAARSVLDIFTGIHSDNNHYLNTLWLYLIGPDASPVTYRLPAILFGTAAVPIAYLIGVRRSVRQGFIFASCVAVSYPLIHFSSEARGYAGAIFAVLLMWLGVLRWRAAPTWREVLVLMFAACLGLLSHLTFVFVWLAFVIWLVVRLPWRRALGQTVLLLTGFAVVPAALLILLYFVDLRYIAVLGGTGAPAWMEITRLVALCCGFPFANMAASVAVAALGLALGLWQIVRLIRRREEEGWFYVVLFLGPMALLFHPPGYFSLRYLLVFVPAFYALLAGLLTDFYAPLRAARPGLPVLAALFLLGQLLLFRDLLTLGRGDHLGAVDFLAANTPTAEITVGTDFPFRAKAELGYYQRFLPPGRRFKIELRQVPEWLMLHTGADEPELPEHISLGNLNWTKAAAFDGVVLSRQEWTFFQPDLPARPAVP